MSLLKFVVSIMTLSLLAACNPTLEVAEENSGEYRYFEDMPTARSAFESAFIQCGDGECPESSVGVFTLHIDSFSSKLGHCSGTLIAPDKVLTNEHCLPEDISQVGASCVGQIRLAFAATSGHSKESVGCERVEQVPVVPEKKDTLRPDWAILKLERPVSRRFRPLSQEGGIQAEQPVKLFKINFDLTSIDPMGYVQETSCLANTHHYFSREHIGPLSAVFNISHCDKKLISGNSGSGVVNQQGDLIGVFSFINPIEDGPFKDEAGSPTAIARIRQRFPNMPQNTGGGTQVACIPFQNKPVPSLCEFDKGYALRALDYQELVSQRLHPDFTESIVKIEQALLAEDPLHIKWAAWRTEMENQLVFDSSLSAQQKFLARLELANLFPWMPICVEATAPQIFSINWYVRTPFNKELVSVKEGWRRTLPTEISVTELSLRKVEEGNYQIHLEELSHYGIQLRLPICD